MKYGDSRIARTWAVGKGLGDLLEKRRRYGDAIWRKAGGASIHVGESNVAVTTDMSSIVHVTK